MEQLMSRRRVLNGTAASLLTMVEGTSGTVTGKAQDAQEREAPLPGDASRMERMKWWKAARFGMFIHFGVYSTIGRHEWDRSVCGE